jgi:hypothetical protein
LFKKKREEEEVINQSDSCRWKDKTVSLLLQEGGEIQREKTGETRV